ncbi:hypothetical protein HPP92_011435 [Vanilla planifolia]|uniref:Smr domain-containing protein n=1 Tax=Vanilla planifolia TaxID=51239 RepID=A0A835V068_VANPL|nr:hypothetical protein HPP92_011435 [Vanilla planifolia]
MECHRAQTIGWAAFDRIHREKLQKAEVIDDPFPSISNVTSADTLKSSTNNYSGKRLVPIQPVPATSFSAVVRASAAIEFPLLKAHTDIGSSNVSFDGDQHPIPLKHNASSVEQLKSIHGWPDQLLIEDILANVNNDVGQASLVLEEMFASDSRTKMEVTGSSGLSTSVVSCGSELEYNIPDLTNSSVDNGLLDNPQKSLMMKHFHVPIEPEWEEDCAYLSKRKEAIKITRAATQHSRSACNAYLRGDHCSAQQLSLRAKKEWMNAQHLHEMAAEEILRTRNSNNGSWKLDLHGLHATEAVLALKQHLKGIESELAINSRASVGSRHGLDNKAMKTTFPTQRQTTLHVITGIGKHSKGEAALPAAVKSFLTDNSYRFEDSRPGAPA